MDVKAVVTCTSSDASEAGYTLNELIVLLLTISVMVGLAVPGILRVRRQAKNEAGAIALLRAVTAAQEAYAKSCGAGGYAVDFAPLGKPGPGADTGYIVTELSRTESPQQNGYHFTLDPGAAATAGPLDCHGIPTQTAYLATAQPIEFGIAGTGNRSFAVTGDRTIWQTRTALPPDEPFASPEVPLD